MGDPESHEYLMDCPPGTKGQAHCDVAIAWWIKKNYPDIEVDIIAPVDISLKRLKANAMNFFMGYNNVSVTIENNAAAPRMMKAFNKCGNTIPTLELETFISQKSRYMKACMDAGVPMAPTIFAPKDKRSPGLLLRQIKQRQWKNFVLKQSESGFSLGFLKLSVAECEASTVLKTYFKDYASCPEFIVQEAIDGFTRNWETRCFWYNGEFLYAIANMAAVSVADGAERIITGDDIPEEFLENAKRIGREAIKALPPLRAPTGQEVPMVLVRTDIGCSDSAIHDKDTNWDPTRKTFFLNEIEPCSTTYFVRFLKFDCIPMYGKLYGDTARLVAEEMKKGPVKVSRSKGKAKVVQKPATAKDAVVAAKLGKGALVKRPAKLVKTKGKSN